MRFKLPFNDRIHVRVLHKVDTVDPQYNIVDTGLEYQDGSIDSIAVGGSFATASGWFSSKDQDDTDDDTEA